MNCSPPGSSLYGIFQARILEWVAISFSRGSSRPEHQIRVSCIAGGFTPIEPLRKPIRKLSSVQSLSHVWLFVTPRTIARQASLSITNPRGLLKFMSSESVMPSSHLILWCPLLLPLQSFPASGSFQMSQFFTSGGQSTRASASASVLPMNNQDWFPLGWTSWISLQSKGLSRAFSNTSVQKHQFFDAQLSL